MTPNRAAALASVLSREELEEHLHLLRLAKGTLVDTYRRLHRRDFHNLSRAIRVEIVKAGKAIDRVHLALVVHEADDRAALAIKENGG